MAAGGAGVVVGAFDFEEGAAGGVAVEGEGAGVGVAVFEGLAVGVAEDDEAGAGELADGAGALLEAVGDGAGVGGELLIGEPRSIYLSYTINRTGARNSR